MVSAVNSETFLSGKLSSGYVLLFLICFKSFVSQVNSETFISLLPHFWWGAGRGEGAQWKTYIQIEKVLKELLAPICSVFTKCRVSHSYIPCSLVPLLIERAIFTVIFIGSREVETTVNQTPHSSGRFFLSYWPLLLSVCSYKRPL